MLQDAANIATIVGAAGILIALFEYRHSVKIAKQQDRRASVELAARECTQFGTEILKEFQELGCKIESQTGFLRESTIEITANNLRYDTTKVSPEELAKMKPLADEALRVLNRLEGFAIPFVAGVADDGIGFVECGRAYVQLFEKYCPLMIFTSNKHYYQSTQKLYAKWKSRIVRQDRDTELTKHVVELTEKIAEASGGGLERAVAKWLRNRVGL